MNNYHHLNHWQLVNREWRKILIVVLVVLFLTLLATLTQPFLYKATLSVLVLQKSSFSIDAYSASKSEERIANKLSQVVGTSMFLGEVFNSGFQIDRTYFPEDEYQLRKKWQKTIETEVPANLSRLDISIYHHDPNEALQISKAAAFLLTAEKNNYIGIEDVDIKVLDTPLVSKYPVKPNVLINILFGLILGGFIGVATVILTYDPNKEKFLEVTKDTHLGPHLIEDKMVLDQVNLDQQELAEAPEIKDLDDVEDLVRTEVTVDSPAEALNSEIKLPDVTGDSFGELPATNIEIETKEEKAADLPIVQPDKKEYAAFEGDDKIVGMPDR